MAEEETQVGGEPTTDAAASPSETPNESRMQELESELTKAKGDLSKIRDFYGAYPKLVPFLKRYADDEAMQQRVDELLDGKAPPQTEDLPPVDDDIKRQIEAHVESRLREERKVIEGQVNQIRQSQLQSQIDGWRRKYTKEAGYPVDFKHCEPQISEMLEKGQAVDVDGAYKQIALDYALKSKTETDKQIKDLKIKASMSRGSIPTTMKVSGKDEKKDLDQAFSEAFEELGIG